MRIITVEKMRQIETTLDASGISYDELMYRAGEALARTALKMVPSVQTPRILILVGKGNNGGDSLVSARLIAEKREDVILQLYLLQKRDDTLMSTLDVPSIVIANAEDDADGRVLRNMARSADLIIDALFGIGVKLPLKNDASKILQQAALAIKERHNLMPDSTIVNPAKPKQIPSVPTLQVLAVDCPSGVDCDNGTVDKHALKADVTLTFIAIKKGLLQYPASAHVGDLLLADCGIDRDHTTMHSITDRLIDARTVRERLPQRPVDGHKGTFGKALIVAGSANYVGAVALATQGAYRSGAGLITVATPRPIAKMLAGHHLEATWLLLPHDMGVINTDAVSALLDTDLSRYQALLIGCGIGTEKSTADFITQLLASQEGNKITKRRIGFHLAEEQDNPPDKVNLPPLIVDADGLNLLAHNHEWWSLLPPDTILTPHVGEMARLANVTQADVIANRWQIAVEKAKEWDVIIVLKGAHTLIATPSGERWVLPFKVSGLATAGTGDILAGLITGFRAQGLNALDASVCGAYVHGLAGSLASKKENSRAMVASDVLNKIGKALKGIEKS